VLMAAATVAAGGASLRTLTGGADANSNHQIFPGQTKTVTFTLPVALRHE